MFEARYPGGEKLIPSPGGSAYEQPNRSRDRNRERLGCVGKRMECSISRQTSKKSRDHSYPIRLQFTEPNFGDAVVRTGW